MFHLEKTQPSFNIFLHRKMLSIGSPYNVYMMYVYKTLTRDIIDFATENEHEKEMARIYLIKFSPIMAWSFI